MAFIPARPNFTLPAKARRPRTLIGNLCDATRRGLKVIGDFHLFHVQNATMFFFILFFLSS